MGLLGAHMSIAGGLEKAIERGESIGCESIQIFSKNQRQWRSPVLKEDEIALFKLRLAESSINAVAIHDSYLINLAQPDPQKLRQSIDAFLDEMIRADKLEVPALVFHPGAAMAESIESGLEKVSDSLNHVLNKQPEGKVKLLIENTAGQGTNLGWSFEQIGMMLDRVDNQDRVGVCLDTAHAFESGYNLSDREEYEKLFSTFEADIGLNKLEVFHINDSKTDLASRVDRHENIGDGKIGSAFFELLVNDNRFRGCPMILETPGGDEMFQENLDFLKSVRKAV